MMTMMMTMQQCWCCWLLKGVHLRFCNTVDVWKEHTRAGNSMRWHFAEEKIMERLRNGFFFNLDRNPFHSSIFWTKHGGWLVWKQHDVAFWKCNLREEARIKLAKLVPMLSWPRRSHPSPPPRIENLRISISSGLGKILNSTSDNLLEGTMNSLKSEFLEEFIRLGPWDSLGCKLKKG